jgi:hypothetical protein
LLEEPFAAHWFANNPVQNIGINEGPNWFHQITGQAIAGVGIDVHQSDARIETECGSSEA